MPGAEGRNVSNLPSCHQQWPQQHPFPLRNPYRVTLENTSQYLPTVRSRYALKSAIKLEIHYDPKSDTLDIGNCQPATEGYDIAENLTAHVDAQGDVVFISVEHAAKILTPHLLDYSCSEK